MINAEVIPRALINVTFGDRSELACFARTVTADDESASRSPTSTNLIAQ